LLAGWSLFAGLHFFLATPQAAADAQVTAMRAKVARMEADYAAAQREASVAAARIEQRQKLIGAVVAGTADPDVLASLLPAEGDLIASSRARALVAPFDRVAREQLALVDTARETADSRYTTMVSQLRKLGLNPRRFHVDTRAGRGGPYEAVDEANAGDPQFRALFLSWKKLDQLQQGVMAVPSQRPVRDLVFSSPFGVRSDPFRGSAAMHSGLDLAGPMGTPVYATADGVVSRAGWANGYGNLVELNHGKGIETRYGHLSKILVRPGQRVKRGDLIAKMGSTGRSTGSHLHYEVRLDGRAVNPLPFLQSADYLAAIQRRAQATQVAMGGPE
jgi:murein DD-endopeptidase MepM/ murein hydrolase activator NlpD